MHILNEKQKNDKPMSNGRGDYRIKKKGENEKLKKEVDKCMQSKSFAEFIKDSI